MPPAFRCSGPSLRLHPRVVIEYGSAGYSAAGIWSGRAIEGHGLGSLSFFKQPAGITIGDIVAMTGAEPRGAAPLDSIIADIASLGRARPSDLTFLDNPKLVDALASTRAAACLTTEQFEPRAPAGVI